MWSIETLNDILWSIKTLNDILWSIKILNDILWSIETLNDILWSIKTLNEEVISALPTLSNMRMIKFYTNLVTVLFNNKIYYFKFSIVNFWYIGICIATLQNTLYGVYIYQLMRSSGAFVHSFCYAVAYKVGTEPRVLNSYVEIINSN